MTMLTTQDPAANTPTIAARPMAQHDKMQWLLAFIFLVLLLGNTIFNKPMLAAALLVYLPFILANLFAYLRQSVFLLVRPFSMSVLWIFFVSSYFWSVVPEVSLNLILTLSAFMILAFFISLCHQVDGFARPLRFSAALLVVLVVLYCLVSPGASLSAIGLKAFYHHKNSLGVMMALCALVLFHAPDRSRWHTGFGLFAIGLLVASQSKTSIILVAICSALLPVAGWWANNFYQLSQRVSMKEVCRSVLYVSALLSLVALVVFRDEFLDLLWTHFTKTMLTSRGTLWLTVIQQIRGNSLLGIGPGAFWGAGGASEIARTMLYQMDPYWVQKIAQADGGYIDLMASLGVLGLALFLLTAVDLYRRLFSIWHQPDSRLMFVLVTFVLLHAITETSILASTNILWFIYLLCYFRVAGYQNSTPSIWQRLWGRKC